MLRTLRYACRVSKVIGKQSFFASPALAAYAERWVAIAMKHQKVEAMLKKIALFLVIILGFAFSGCQSVDENTFAIYLFSQDVPTAKLSQTDINELMLEDKPIISSDDIVSYDKTNHTIELTREASRRLQQIFPMPVKVDGIPFVVCVGNERIYTGAFWTLLSSLSYDGVVILQSFDSTATTIQLTLGYPGPDVFTGIDPRADPRIMKALEQSKKLE